MLPVETGFYFVRVFRFRRRGPPLLYQGGNSVQALEPGFTMKEVPLYMRVKITLRCNECKQRNYNTVKNKKNDPDRLEMKKYCPFCRKHTVHSETK